MVRCEREVLGKNYILHFMCKFQYTLTFFSFSPIKLARSAGSKIAGEMNLVFGGIVVFVEMFRMVSWYSGSKLLEILVNLDWINELKMRLNVVNELKIAFDRIMENQGLTLGEERMTINLFMERKWVKRIWLIRDLSLVVKRSACGQKRWNF